MDISLPPAVDSNIRAAIEAFDAGNADYSFDLSTLKLKIKLSGPRWAGIVDKPLAKFLLELDKVVQSELNRMGVHVPDGDHGLVALKIEDGSMEAFLQYSKGIFQEIRKMTLKQQLLISVTILTAIGLPVAPSIISALNEPGIAATESEERVNLIKSVGEVLEKTYVIQKPVRGLIGDMDGRDRLELPGAPEPMKKEQAKAALAKASKSEKPDTYHIDGRYIVQELLTKDPENWVIGLNFGTVSFRAKILLTHEQVSSLMADFQAAHAKGTEIAPDFQVTATIDAQGNIKKATVVGMGEPRDEAVKLSTALKQAKIKAASDADLDAILAELEERKIQQIELEDPGEDEAR